MKTLMIVECECHPMTQWGPFKWRKLEYLQDLNFRAFGWTHVILARPHKGCTDIGMYVKAFGYIWTVALRRVHA